MEGMTDLQVIKLVLVLLYNEQHFSQLTTLPPLKHDLLSLPDILLSWLSSHLKTTPFPPFAPSFSFTQC